MNPADEIRALCLRIPEPLTLAQDWGWDNPDTLERQALLFFEQRARCALCFGPLWNGGRVLDHDHQTGFIRGWLCKSCNGTEPRRTDEHVIEYRRNPPGKNRWQYEHPFGFTEPQPRDEDLGQSSSRHLSA